MNSKYVLLGCLYFVQGMPYGLQSGLLPIYLRSVGLSFTKISLAKMLYLPWILKVLWAPLVDRYHTKHTWLALSMAGLGLACLACATLSPETNFLPVAALLLLMNFFASVQDIAVDGVAVQVLGQGEQGATTMFPLFLLDHGFSTQQLGFWNGVVAMFFSITGSSLGGQLMSKQRRPLSLLKALLLLRFCSLNLQIFLVFIYDDGVSLFKGAAILSICVQHFIGGLITTLAFSAMMQCTQRADDSIQATHYSFLATLEVLGKLAFSTFVGSIVDWLGFASSFCCFLFLSFTSVLYVLNVPPSGS